MTVPSFYQLLTGYESSEKKVLFLPIEFQKAHMSHVDFLIGYSVLGKKGLLSILFGIKRGVESIKVLGIQMILCQSKSFSETLEMDNLPLS